jgi:type IV secretion system protein TrbL
MKKILLFSLFFLFPLTCSAVAMDATTASAIVQDAITLSTKLIFDELSKTAFKMLTIFMMLQWFITHFKSLMSGDEIQTVLGKTAMAVAWGSVVYYLMDNGVDWLRQISEFFYGSAESVAGAGFSPGYVMEFGLTITANLLNAVSDAQGILGSLNPLPSIMTGFCSFAILIITGLIAFKVFMLLAETSIVIALAPMSFAFLGLNAMKEQGLVPFKYLVSMAYRAMIYAAVIAAMGTLGGHIVAVLKTLPTLHDTDIWTPIFSIVLGYGMLGALAMRADSIAAMLASGSSQMSTGDASAVAVSAAAAGGAIGGAVLGAAGMASGGLASAPKAMSSFMTEMTGGGGGASKPFTTPQISDAPPQRANSTPAPSPTTAAGKAMAEAGSKAAGGNVSQQAINAGVEALSSGQDKSAAMSAMMDAGANPRQAKNAINAMKPDGSAAGGGIGGSANQNSAPSGRSGGLTESLANMDRHLSRDDKATHVSINLNAN